MTNQQFSLMFFGGAFVVVLVALVIGEPTTENPRPVEAKEPSDEVVWVDAEEAH